MSESEEVETVNTKVNTQLACAVILVIASIVHTFFILNVDKKICSEVGLNTNPDLSNFGKFYNVISSVCTVLLLAFFSLKKVDGDASKVFEASYANKTFMAAIGIVSFMLLIFTFAYGGYVDYNKNNTDTSIYNADCAFIFFEVIILIYFIYLSYTKS